MAGCGQYRAVHVGGWGEYSQTLDDHWRRRVYSSQRLLRSLCCMCHRFCEAWDHRLRFITISSRRRCNDTRFTTIVHNAASSYVTCWELNGENGFEWWHHSTSPFTYPWSLQGVSNQESRSCDSGIFMCRSIAYLGLERPFWFWP